MEDKVERAIKFQQNEDNRDQLDHQNALLAIASIIKTDQGKKLFRYLFKSLDVCELPSPEMEGTILHEYLGLLRAGNSIYKLACEADSEISASILSKIEREKYDRLIEQHRIENDLN